MNAPPPVEVRTSGAHKPFSTPVAPSPKKKRKWRLWLWIALLLALVCGVVAFVLSHDERVAVTVEKSAIRNITQIVTATGKVRPEIEIKISPEVAGEIVELPVVDGQTVKRGDLLVKIKPDNYIADVRQAQASLDAAEADSLQRKTQMLNDELDYKRAEELFQKKLISDTDFKAAKTKQEVSEASYQASLHRIDQARGILDQTKTTLEKCVIYSPIEGSVSVLNSELGERVVATGSFAGTEVMRVADLNSLEARVDVNENDVVAVKINDPVHVRIDAYPGHEFRGVVRRIASTATVQNQGTQQEVTNFEVRIAILSPDRIIRPGMSASVDIDTQTVTQVISVPVQSVTVRSKDNGKTREQLAEDRRTDAGGSTAVDAEKRDRKKLERVVFVKQGDIAKQVPVTTGIADDNYIQIISGLQPGQEIVSGPYSAISKTLKDGSKIKLEEVQSVKP